ncbi:hypothetical protein LguiA_032071 [Lonicera macranthoides]
MTESKRGNRNTFETLAPEIISEILCRLPIEWILRCKSVCKTWHTLIKDHYFVKLQLSRSNNQPSSQVIVESWEYSQHISSCGVSKLYLLSLEDCKSREIQGFPLADVNSCPGLLIMCFFDGLICVAPDKDLDPVVIYNPLIRGDYIVLPKTEVGKVYIALHRVTLGFDPSINKYKAVRMLNYSVNSYYDSMCEVITIGEENSWRRVVAPYAGLIEPLCRGGVFHHGSIYWIIDKFRIFHGESSTSSRSREFILEFDVTKEVFGAVSFPPSVRTPKYHEDREFSLNLQLQVLEGGILALMEYDGQLLHIWRLLKQNGTQVVGYSSYRIELPYKKASIRSLLCPSGTENLLLLQIYGSFQQGRRRRRRGSPTIKEELFYYYPSNKKNNQYVNLSSLRIPYSCFYLWCFKPSLLSIKAALLGHL